MVMKMGQKRGLAVARSSITRAAPRNMGSLFERCRHGETATNRAFLPRRKCMSPSSHANGNAPPSLTNSTGGAHKKAAFGLPVGFGAAGMVPEAR